MRTGFLLAAAAAAILSSADAAAGVSGFKDVISSQKAFVLDGKEEYYEAVGSLGGTSWISDINLQVSESYAPGDLKSRTYSASYVQPIYRGGNIWKDILYSQKERDINQMVVESERDQAIYAILSNMLSIQKLTLSRKTTNLSLKSNEIDMKRKKELYENGILDITFISDLIIKRNSIKNRLIEVDTSIRTLKNKLSMLTPLSYEDLLERKDLLSLIRLVDKETFLERNYMRIDKERASLSGLDAQRKANDLLPTVSFNINAFDTDDGVSRTNGYYGGVRVSVPISLNRYKSSQAARAKGLLESSRYLDRASEEGVFYDNRVSEISTIKEKIKNIEEAIAEYDRLIGILEKDYRLGLTVKSDLTLLKINRDLKTSQRDEEINAMKQKILEIVSRTKIGG